MVGLARILCLVGVISSFAWTSLLVSESCRAAMDRCDPGQLQDVTRSTMARVAGGDMVTGIAEIIECEVPRL